MNKMKKGAGSSKLYDFDRFNTNFSKDIGSYLMVTNKRPKAPAPAAAANGKPAAPIKKKK